MKQNFRLVKGTHEKNIGPKMVREAKKEGWNVKTQNRTYHKGGWCWRSCEGTWELGS